MINWEFEKNLRPMSDADLIKSINVYDNWIEEIFADVYGCLVAGPAMAL